jgi:hypothetical protein
MPRITVKAHHEQFLQLIAQQMGTNTATALDYALWELKKQGYSFSSPLAPSTPSTPMPPTAIGEFVHYREVTPVTTPTATPSTDPEPDEVIAKFLALGMEEF